MISSEPSNEAILRGEIEKLLISMRGALAALSQPVTFTRARSDREHVRAYTILSADVAIARQWLTNAIAQAEGVNNCK